MLIRISIGKDSDLFALAPGLAGGVEGHRDDARAVGRHKLLWPGGYRTAAARLRVLDKQGCRTCVGEAKLMRDLFPFANLPKIKYDRIEGEDREVAAVDGSVRTNRIVDEVGQGARRRIGVRPVRLRSRLAGYQAGQGEERK